MTPSRARRTLALWLLPSLSEILTQARSRAGARSPREPRCPCWRARSPKRPLLCPGALTTPQQLSEATAVDGAGVALRGAAALRPRRGHAGAEISAAAHRPIRLRRPPTSKPRQPSRRGRRQPRLGFGTVRTVHSQHATGRRGSLDELLQVRLQGRRGGGRTGPGAKGIDVPSRKTRCHRFTVGQIPQTKSKIPTFLGTPTSSLQRAQRTSAGRRMARRHRARRPGSLAGTGSGERRSRRGRGKRCAHTCTPPPPQPPTHMRGACSAAPPPPAPSMASCCRGEVRLQRRPVHPACSLQAYRLLLGGSRSGGSVGGIALPVVHLRGQRAALRGQRRERAWAGTSGRHSAAAASHRRRSRRQALRRP